MVKNLPAMQESQVRTLDQEDPRLIDQLVQRMGCEHASQ